MAPPPTPTTPTPDMITQRQKNLTVILKKKCHIFVPWMSEFGGSRTLKNNDKDVATGSIAGITLNGFTFSLKKNTKAKKKT